MTPPRVLVVDDSAVARKVVREALERSGAVEIVGFARDGLEALDRIHTLAPDVVTLDLMLPELDGVGVLAALPPGGPRVVVVTSLGSDADAAIQALQLGALELVQKPTAVGDEARQTLEAALVAAVLRAATAIPLRAAVPKRVSGAGVDPLRSASLIIVGTSTGGPQALSRLFADLPLLDVPLVALVHIPPGYTEALAARLDKVARCRVTEAADGGVLRPGEAVIAKAGVHLCIERGTGGLVTRFRVDPVSAPHRPSLDVLFASAAAAAGAGVIGVVLTGMGSDGLEGARAIHREGGRLLTQSADSCVVYGMPRVVHEAGLSEASVPLEDMASAIARRVATVRPLER